MNAQKESFEFDLNTVYRLKRNRKAQHLYSDLC